MSVNDLWITCHVWNKYISEVFFDLCSGISACTVGTVGIAGFHCQRVPTNYLLILLLWLLLTLMIIIMTYVFWEFSVIRFVQQSADQT